MKINLHPELKRYYIAIGSLSLLIIVIALVNIFGSTSLRHDYRLEGKISNIQENVDSYVSSKNKLPEILPDSGIKESGGVEYKRVSDTRYMLCAVFKTKSDGYAQPDRYYIDQVKTESLQSGVSLDANTHFTDGNKQGLAHEKGYGCIVYEPYQLSNNYQYPYVLCNSEKFKLQPIYSQSIVSVNPTTRQITIKSSDYSSAHDRLGAPISENTTYTLSADAKVFNTQCKEVGLDMIKPGDTIEIYRQTSGNTADAVWITFSSSPPLPATPRTTPNNNPQ